MSLALQLGTRPMDVEAQFMPLQWPKGRITLSGGAIGDSGKFEMIEPTFGEVLNTTKRVLIELGPTSIEITRNFIHVVRGMKAVYHSERGGFYRLETEIGKGNLSCVNDGETPRRPNDFTSYTFAIWSKNEDGGVCEVHIHKGILTVFIGAWEVSYIDFLHLSLYLLTGRNLFFGNDPRASFVEWIHREKEPQWLLGDGDSTHHVK